MVTRPSKAAVAAVTKPDFASLFADARLPERTVPICLRGDLVAEHEQLERQLERVQKTASDSLAGNGAGELVERIEALEAEMAEHTYPFRIRALPKPKWRQFVADHPPRKGEDGEVLEIDARAGFNTETYFDDMVKACLVDPALDDTEWARLSLEVLTDGQMGELSDAAWAVNRGTVDVPFSRAASLAKRAIADGSN